MLLLLFFHFRTNMQDETPAQDKVGEKDDAFPGNLHFLVLIIITHIHSPGRTNPLTGRPEFVVGLIAGLIPDP